MADASKQSSSSSNTSTARVVVYWLVVGLPFLYGLSGTINKSLALFQ